MLRLPGSGNNSSAVLSTMSLRPDATLSCARASPLGVLWMLLSLSLLLTLLVPPATGQSESAEMYFELRCMCLKTTSGIHPSNINNLEVIKPGPHCANVEVIATLKNGRKICLDPKAPGVKKMIQKILENSESTA